jgi:uncharacterized ion transporter superfamily protein YfcC
MKNRKFPDAIVIIIFLMIAIMVLTWIVPAGEFEYSTHEGRNIVKPGSYFKVDSSPQGLFALLRAPIRGFVGAAQIIGFCFLVGGAFGILNKTGAIDSGLQSVIRFSKNRHSYRRWVLALITLLFSLCGASFGMSESVLVFIMITIPLALALGYDSIVGISISFLAAGVGFAGAFTNPFNIGVAQGIAGLPLFSGWEYRMIVWLVLTIATIIYILWYAKKLEKDETISPVYELDNERRKNGLSVDDNSLVFNWKRKFILILLFLALASIIVGSNKWGWYINEIAALFLALGILSALVMRLNINETITAFIGGAKDMVKAALVIGMAKGLLIIATDGKIIGTMLAFMAEQFNGLPKLVSVQIMFVFQGFLNFFVPSGSGQAALATPIMAPLSDLLGITRQTWILCFQMGELYNPIIPTSGVTMGVISISNIPYNKWVKWVFPLILIFVVLALLLLIPPAILFTYN